MKIKLTNERIVDSVDTLKELNNAKLPVKVAYAITKNINKIDNELKAYIEEKSKLIDKYGEKDKEGKLKIDEKGNIPLKKEYIEDYNKDIKELLSIENEIDIHMIELYDLLNSNYSISPAELTVIDFMIND